MRIVQYKMSLKTRVANSATGRYTGSVNPGSGAVPLTFTVGGVAGTQMLYLAVSN
jgi:hypothetical protein